VLRRLQKKCNRAWRGAFEAKLFFPQQREVACCYSSVAIFSAKNEVLCPDLPNRSAISALTNSCLLQLPLLKGRQYSCLLQLPLLKGRQSWIRCMLQLPYFTAGQLGLLLEKRSAVKATTKRCVLQLLRSGSKLSTGTDQASACGSSRSPRQQPLAHESACRDPPLARGCRGSKSKTSRRKCHERHQNAQKRPKRSSERQNGSH